MSVFSFLFSTWDADDVGRTHIIVRFQTGNRRKDNGTENFGGFVYVSDRFPQRDFVLWVFVYPINISPFRPSRVLFCVLFVLFVSIL